MQDWIQVGAPFINLLWGGPNQGIDLKRHTIMANGLLQWQQLRCVFPAWMNTKMVSMGFERRYINEDGVTTVEKGAAAWDADSLDNCLSSCLLAGMSIWWHRTIWSETLGFWWFHFQTRGFYSRQQHGNCIGSRHDDCSSELCRNLNEWPLPERSVLERPMVNPEWQYTTSASYDDSRFMNGISYVWMVRTDLHRQLEATVTPDTIQAAWNELHALLKDWLDMCYATLMDVWYDGVAGVLLVETTRKMVWQLRGLFGSEREKNGLLR